MTSPHIIRRLLLATTCAWGLSSMAVRAEIGDEPLPAQSVELQHMTADEADEKCFGLVHDMARIFALEREQARQWLKRQWAVLSPEQRDQLRNQVREHWRGMTPEQRQHLREVRQNSNSENFREQQQEVRPQRLSPDERQEFRQWMRERHSDSGGNGDRDRGGGPP